MVFFLSSASQNFLYSLAQNWPSTGPGSLVSEGPQGLLSLSSAFCSWQRGHFGDQVLGEHPEKSWDPSPGNGRGEQGVSYEEVVEAGSHQICGYGQESEDLGVSGHPGGP